MSSDNLDRNPPSAGGCWICETGNGREDDDMVFDIEFDTFYHPSCLEDYDVESVLEYERQSPDTGGVRIEW